MAESLAGKLLVASPVLTDPNFARSVIFMCMHDELSALGLVLNRPLDVAPLHDLLPQWAASAGNHAVLFRGGPVEPGSALALARPQEGVALPNWTEVTQRTGLFDLGQDVDAVAPQLGSLRVFTGYAGWAAGQLEGELSQKAWFVVDPMPGDVFSERPEELWRDVLRRQGGDLALVALYPEDASLN